MQGLTNLDIRGNGVTDAEAQAIADSPYMRNLTNLNISNNSIKIKAHVFAVS